MSQNSDENGSGAGPLDRLKSEATGLLDALSGKAVTSLRGTVEGAAERLTDYAKAGANPAVKSAAVGVKSLAEGKSPVSSLVSAGTTAAKDKVGDVLGKSKGGGKEKITNIIETIDVGVPVRLAYDQWTRFTDFPSFMKKVESVEQPEDEKLTWKAKVLWSHRTWESTILEQMPDDKIIWRSKGSKGYVDGAVTFHELAPSLTRILVALEYHPRGFFEHTGNLWRAQGRRVRLELKNYRRHVMTEALLHSDDVEGWRGVISDGNVKQSGGRGKGSDKNKAAKPGRKSGSGDADGKGRSSSSSSGRVGRGQSASSGARQSSTRRSSTSQPSTSQPSARKSSTSQGGRSSGSAPSSGSARRSSGSSARSGSSTARKAKAS